MFPGISFGAACPLNSVEKTLLDAVAKLPTQKTEVLRGVLQQLCWFAGKQVKSVAVSPYLGAQDARFHRKARGASLDSAADPMGVKLKCLELPGVFVENADSWAPPSERLTAGLEWSPRVRF